MQKPRLVVSNTFAVPSLCEDTLYLLAFSCTFTTGTEAKVQEITAVRLTETLGASLMIHVSV